MKDNEIINNCKRMIAKDNISDSQFLFCERKLKNLLVKFESKGNNQTHNLLGKLYLLCGNTLDAKKYFNKAKEINPNNQSIYHGLFKLDILDGNYINASSNLEKFIELDQFQNLNLELYRLLVNNCLKKECQYKIDNTFFYVKLSGQNLILYLNGVKSILDNEYENAKSIFEQLNILTTEQKAMIRFDYVVKIIDHIIENKKIELDTMKDNKINIFNEKREKLKEFIWNSDEKGISSLVCEMLEMDTDMKQKKWLMHAVPRMLQIDIYEPSLKIVTTIQKSDNDNEYSRMTSFYEKLIKENYEIYSLSDDKKEVFQTYLRNGIDYFNDGLFEKALENFSIGLYETNTNLFNYYIGKTYLKCGLCKKAKDKLDLYNQDGAIKLDLCKYYLSIISLKFGKKGKFAKYSEDSKYFSSLLNKNYETKINPFLVKEDLKNGIEYREIDMKEEDFIVNVKTLKNS